MRLNVSAVKRFHDCRLRWYYEYILNRVPVKPAPALEFGKAYHRIMDTHFQGFSMADGIYKERSALESQLEGTKLWDTPPPEVLAEQEGLIKTLAELAKYEEVLLQWKDTYPVAQMLAVEEPFEFEYKGITLIGRPDREGVVFGKTMHIQNRSLSKGDMALYRNLARWDMHELLYAWALAQKYPERPYGGTLFNIMKKVQYRGKPTKKDPEGKILRPISEILWQFPVTMTKDRIQRCLDDLVWTAEEMERTVEDITQGREPAINRNLNAGYFGNSFDPYVDVFDGRVDLMDNTKFKDREDPYAGRQANKISG